MERIEIRHGDDFTQFHNAASCSKNALVFLGISEAGAAETEIVTREGKCL